MPVARRDVACVVLCFASWLAAWGAVADEPPAAPAEPRFQPGEISIGEPLALPPKREPAGVPANEPPAAAAASTVPGNGWIGLTADEKVVTGRLVVVDVAEGGPAEAAGIRLQDHVLAIDGMPLRSADQLAAALAAIAPGSLVKIAVGRGERVEEVSLTATTRPVPAKPTRPAREWQAAEPAAPTPARPPEAAPSPAASAPLTPPSFAAPVARPTAAPAPLPAIPPSAAQAAKGRTALGVRTKPVDPAAQARFRLTEPAGAFVIGVVHDLPASKAGVPPGSVIVALDNQPVRSPSELSRIVTSGPVDRPVTLQYILPGGEARRAEVSLQSLELPLEQALVGPEP